MTSSFIRKTSFRAFKLGVNDDPAQITIEADEAYLLVRSDCVLRISRERERALTKMVEQENVGALDLNGPSVFDSYLSYGAGPLNLKALPGSTGEFFDSTVTPANKFIGVLPVSLGTGIKEQINVALEALNGGNFALFYIEEVHYVPSDLVAA